MKPEEIKEALEIYIALYGRDIYIADNTKVADILDLINQYEEKVKKCEKVEHFADKTIATLQAENERLEEAKNAYKDIVDTCEIGAIKEFSQRLRHNLADKIEDSFNDPNGEHYFITDIFDDIDNLLKEMGVE